MENNLTYTRNGDYLIPDLKLSEQPELSLINIFPTRNIREADLSALPVGERAILELVALRLLCAVAPVSYTHLDQVPDLFHRGRQHPLRQAPSGAHRDRCAEQL